MRGRGGELNDGISQERWGGRGGVGGLRGRMGLCLRVVG